LYSANYTASQLLLLFVTPFEFVLLPVASSLWDRNQRDLAVELITGGVRVFLLLSVPTGAALVVYGGHVLGAMSTDAIAAAAPAFLPPLVVAMILWGCTRLFFYLFLVEKRSGVVARIVAIAAVVNVIGNLFAIERWGPVAAAWMTLVAYAVALAFTLASVGWARLRVFSLRWIAALLGASAVMTVALVAMPAPRTLLGVLAGSAVGLVVFVAAAIAGGVVGKDTLRLFLERRPRAPGA
jgi:O-antigen/teichoic acid export membrane protein